MRLPGALGTSVQSHREEQRIHPRTASRSESHCKLDENFKKGKKERHQKQRRTTRDLYLAQIYLSFISVLISSRFFITRLT